MRGVVLKILFYLFGVSINLKKFFKIDQGGWHFSYLMTAEEIANKISSSPHQEFNLDEFKNIEQIKIKLIILRIYMSQIRNLKKFQ